MVCCNDIHLAMRSKCDSAPIMNSSRDRDRILGATSCSAQPPSRTRSVWSLKGGKGSAGYSSTLCQKLKARGSSSGCAVDDKGDGGLEACEIGIRGVEDSIEARERRAPAFYRPPQAPLGRHLGTRVAANGG